MLIIGVIFLFLLIFDYIDDGKLYGSTIAYVSDREEILKILAEETEETAIIYLGKIDNNKITSLINTYDKNINIYYLDIEDEKTILSYENEKVVVIEEGSSYYKKLLKTLDCFTEIYDLQNKYNEPINSGYRTIYTPFLIYLKDGKIVYTYYITDIDNEEVQNNIINGFKEMM